MLKSSDVETQAGVHDPTEAAQRAFLTLLFNKYRGALLRHVGRFTASREDAADLVQDTYLRVMDRISMSRFDGEARAYLFQTATNLARDHHRRQKFRAHAALDEAAEDTLRADDPTPEQIISADQVTAALRVAIGEMPEQTRAVFLMARSRELSYEDIARRLGMGRRTVERRVAEAVAFLAGRLRGSP
ncbi:MAG TPA: sigma-70 family RNA polymerase sigma factor [Steroidobacteraceae bacterium]|nr:sigma-70 family RNA polymerase sigma factor [Steroidobacteraceae bacterium]